MTMKRARKLARADKSPARAWIRKHADRSEPNSAKVAKLLGPRRK
jgi:hypothetical protein